MSPEYLPKCISLPESESGHLPYGKPNGQMIGQSGPAIALANLLARRAKEMGLMMSGTYGQPSTTSFASVNLSESLASIWQAITALHGSTLYKLTSKQRATPLLSSISAVRASVRRTSGWPTPAARDGKCGYLGGRIRNGKISNDILDVTAQLAGWLTPLATNINARLADVFEKRKEARLATGRTSLSPGNLAEQAQLYCGDHLQTIAGWTTPMADGDNRKARPHLLINSTRPDGSKIQKKLQDYAAASLPVRLTGSEKMLNVFFAKMENSGHFAQIIPAG